MYTLIAENAKGETINFAKDQRYTLVSVDGLTPTTATINTTEIPGGDGAYFNSARIGKRNIVLTVYPEIEITQARRHLYTIFPVKSEVVIYYTAAGRSVRIAGYVESIDGSLFAMRQSLQISIICPQPYFKAIDEVVADLSMIRPVFEFPFATQNDGVEMSVIDKTYQTTLINSGEVETGMIIELTAAGSVTNPTIYDETHGGAFAISVIMTKGEVIRINTNSGEKSVYMYLDNDRQNYMNLIGNIPTWFQLEPGETVFAFTADDGEENLRVRFIYNEQFAGV